MPPTSALAPFTGRQGLNVSVSGAVINAQGNLFIIPGQQLNCQPNATNYGYLTVSPTVALAINQSGFPSANSLPIFIATTDQSIVRNLVDFRPDWYLVNPGAAGVVAATQTLPGQTGNIASTPLLTVPSGSGIMYCVYADVIVTTAAAQGTLQVVVSWNNGTTTSSLTSAPFSLTAQGEDAALLGNFFAAAGSNVTFSVTLSNVVGNPVYQVALRLLALG